MPHNGSQKKFRIGTGYRRVGNDIIREWNNDEKHYRKFISHLGSYLDDIKDSEPKQGDLYFWGEWEGNSLFKPLNNTDIKILPNGIHECFHSTVIRGGKNTDPYIYGEQFKWCVCKQKGRRLNLDLGSIIFFGTNSKNLEGYYIDTIFVIENHDTSEDVVANSGIGYTQVYREETLEQLNEYLGIPHEATKNRIYKGKQWGMDNKYFSYVPCKLKPGENGFERFYLDHSDPIFDSWSKNPTGVFYLKTCNLSANELWEEISAMVSNQGFKLGVEFEEPKKSSILDMIGIKHQQDLMKY